MEKKTGQIQVKIEPSLKKKFQEWCEVRSINQSEFLRRKIIEALEKEK